MWIVILITKIKNGPDVLTLYLCLILIRQTRKRKKRIIYDTTQTSHKYFL